MKIGVFMESFRQPFEEVVEMASAMGAQGFQMYARAHLNKSQYAVFPVLFDIPR